MSGDRSGLVVPAVVVVWVIASAAAVSSAFGPRPPQVVATFDPPRAFVLLEGSYELRMFDPNDGSIADTSTYELTLPWSWSYADERIEVAGTRYLHVVGGTLSGWYIAEGGAVTMTDVESPSRPDPPTTVP
jgi:hypothetical protein